LCYTGIEFGTVLGGFWIADFISKKFFDLLLTKTGTYKFTKLKNERKEK